jgi:hypothetical protein
LARIFRWIRRRHYVAVGGSCVSCCVSALICGAGVVLLLSLFSYGRLIDEKIVGRIEFRHISPQEFQARLMLAGEKDRLFTLHGDEWQLDAKIVTWKPPMTILGLDPMYQLDRLSGRYSEISREVSATRTVHSLAPAMPVDIWRAARQFPMLTPGMDAFYGTATYVPMADGALYEISLSRDALIARPANDRARAAVGDWGTEQ